MKKVLIIVKTLSLGGVSNVVCKYYDALKNAEDIVMDIAAGNPIESRYSKMLDPQKSEIFVLPERDSNIFRYIIYLTKKIKVEKYDVVHVHGNSALIFPELLAAKLGGVTRIIAHSHSSSCDHPKLEKKVRWLFDLLYTDAVACSEASGKWMFRKKFFKVLKNGLNLSENIYVEVEAREQKEKLHLEGKFVIGHVGAFNDIKNHDYLLEIFNVVSKKCQDAILFLVGDGELMPFIKEKTQKMNLMDKVVFFGVSDDVKSLMMAMDVFVLPSKFEGLPCVLVEAQSVGLPCVVSSKVSKEAKMSKEYFSCDIDNSSLEEWSNKILKLRGLDRVEIQKENHLILKEQGYDIQDAAQELMELYLK